MNYRQIYAIEQANKNRILSVCPDCPDESGIYFLIRKDGGFKWAYIGQAKKLLTRLAGHLLGYQHIDLSIKKHGLYSEDNPTGWEINFLKFPEEELDEKEQYYIRAYANAGFQLRNHESGGKDGKFALENRTPSKTYYQGLKQGYANAQKEVSHLFKLHLDYSAKKTPPSKLQVKALEKFKKFLEVSSENDEQV